MLYAERPAIIFITLPYLKLKLIYSKPSNQGLKVTLQKYNRLKSFFEKFEKGRR